MKISTEIKRSPADGTESNIPLIPLFKRPIGIFYGGFDGSRDVSSMESDIETEPTESDSLILHRQRKVTAGILDAPDITAQIDNKQVVVEPSKRILSLLERVLDKNYEVTQDSSGYLLFKFDDLVFESTIRIREGKIQKSIKK